MNIAFLKFSKALTPKIAALLSQYGSVKTLISVTNEDLFDTKVTIAISVSADDLLLMTETELNNYFKPFN